MSGPYLCRSPNRVNALKDAALASPPRLLNGIQYLEVAPSQRLLEVHFVHPLALVPAAPLKAVNVEIRGGGRIRADARHRIHDREDVHRRGGRVRML